MKNKALVTRENSSTGCFYSALHFDLALLEKPDTEGLSKLEINKLLDMIGKNEEYLPIEIDNPNGGSTAIGFIGFSASGSIDHDLNKLKDYIKSILADMNLESRNGTYKFQNINIYMSRSPDCLSVDIARTYMAK